MSSDAEPHSPVIEVVKEPHHFLATVGATYSDAEKIQAFVFDHLTIQAYCSGIG